MKITTINPATEEILAEYDAIPAEQVKNEVQDSRMVFNSIWKEIDISERCKRLRS